MKHALAILILASCLLGCEAAPEPDPKVCFELIDRHRRFRACMENDDPAAAMAAIDHPGRFFPSDFPNRSAASLRSELNDSWTLPEGWPPSWTSETLAAEVSAFMAPVYDCCED